MNQTHRPHSTLNSLALDRVLPNSREAEIAVLGAMLLEPNDAGALCRDRLTEEFFYYAAHQVIFREIAAMLDALHAVDLVTLTQRFHDKHVLEEIGGPAFLSELITSLPTTANIEEYIAVVVDKHMLRQMINIAADMIAKSFEQQDAGDLLLGHAVDRLTKLGSSQKTARHISEILPEVQDSVDRIRTSERHISGFDTGFARLNELTQGLQPGLLYVIAGMPSGGKTALAVNICTHVAKRDNVPVGIFTMEQNDVQIVSRMVAGEARVNLRQVRYAREQQLTDIGDSVMRLHKLPIYIDDGAALRPSQVLARARRMKSQWGIKLFMLDYLQLMRADNPRAEDVQRITECVNAIKAIAKTLEVPFILISQFNRKPETDGRRPRLSDLHGGSEIEKAADVALLLSRRFEREELPPQWKSLKQEIIDDLVFVDLAKQRDGEVGQLFLRFNRDFTLFEDLAMEREPGDMSR